MTYDSARNWRAAASVLLALFLLTMWSAAGPVATPVQGADDTTPAAEDQAGPSGEDPAGPSAPAPNAGSEDVSEDGESAADDEESDSGFIEGPEEGQLSLIWLVLRGGYLMIPIGLMSLMVAMFGVERAIGLRRSRIMPQEIVDGLGQLSATPGGFDPRKAYRLCQRYPSSTATVIKAMLLKVGRPHGEVEHAVAEASEREATRLYANVRWLNLAAAVSPLLGLLGTVWGMIQAFFQTTQLQAGQNKADFLAQGIYVALVTTLGGLAVAIPAAILAHYFEGRIQNLFHQVDELLFNLLPQIERYEGRLRVSHQSLGGDGTAERPIAATAADEDRAAATVPK